MLATLAVLLYCVYNQEEWVSLVQRERVDLRVLLDPWVKPASLDPQVNKAALVLQDPREPRYQELSEQPVQLELLAQLDSKELKDLPDRKDRMVNQDSKELPDRLDNKDRRDQLDSKDLRDKQAILDLLEVKVYTLLQYLSVASRNHTNTLYNVYYMCKCRR